MDGIGKPEWETQLRVIKLFKEELKYRYLGNWEERQENKHIEEGDLAKSGYGRGSQPASGIAVTRRHAALQIPTFGQVTCLESPRCESAS